jgi:hypothetical protein
MADISRYRHLALATAASIAYRQLTLAPQAGFYDAEHLSATLCVIAQALAKAAPIYLTEGDTAARPLTDGELQGAIITRGATRLTLKDGRVFSKLSMRRGDMWDAITLLRAAGMQVAEPVAQPAPGKE